MGLYVLNMPIDSYMGDRKEIFITYLIIIMKSKYQSFPLLSYCSVVMCLVWLQHYMLSVSYIFRESWVLFLLLLCSLMTCGDNRVHYGPIVVVLCLRVTPLEYHHYTIMQTYLKLVSKPQCTNNVTWSNNKYYMIYSQSIGLFPVLYLVISSNSEDLYQQTFESICCSRRNIVMDIQW